MVSIDDFSGYQERFKPIVLSTVPASIEECIWSVVEAEGSKVSTSCIQNTAKLYDLPGTSVYAGEVMKAAVIAQTIIENGFDYVNRTQALILLCNIGSVKIGENHTSDLIDRIYQKRSDRFSIRELFDKAGIPKLRNLSAGLDQKRIPMLCEMMKDAPEELAIGELRKYLVTRKGFSPIMGSYEDVKRYRGVGLNSYR